MKKFFLFVLATLFFATSPLAHSATREDYVKHFESCEAIIREFMADRAYAIPTTVLQQARGIIIVNSFKAGFIFGVKGGYGVILVKKPDGKWSLPVLINAGEASLGLQFGAKSDETIYVMMDDATPKLLFNGRFNVGVDAKAVAGAGDFEGDLGVLGAVPPASGLVRPNNAVALDPASIGKDEIVERARIGKDHDAVGRVRCLKEFGVTVHDDRDRGSANRLGLECRVGGCRRRQSKQDREREQRYDLHTPDPP